MRLARILSAAALLSASAARGQTVDLNVISKVDVEDSGAAVVVTIRGSRPPNFTTFSMMDPPRFVIDLSQSTFQNVPEDVRVENGVINVIKNLSYGSEATSIARVMIAFSREVDPPDVQVQGENLVVRVVKPAGTPVAQAPPADQAARAEAEAQAREQEKAKADAEAAARAAQEARAKAEEEARRQAEAAAPPAAPAAVAAAAPAASPAPAAGPSAEAVPAAGAAVAPSDAEREAKADEQARLEAEARAREEQAAKARDEQDARRAREAQAKAEADARAAAETQAKAEADARAAAETQAKAEADARAAAEAQAKADADAKARAEAEQRAREAQAKAEAEARAAEAQASAAPEARARAEEAPAPSPPIAALPPSETRPPPMERVPSGRPSQVQEIGFKQMPGVSRVFVRTTTLPAFTILDAGENVIRVELANTRVKRRNDTRFLDTSFFPSAVAMVTPKRQGSTYVLEIKLKQKVPYQQKVEGDMLAIDFERPGATGPAAHAPPAAGPAAAPPPRN